MEKIIDGIPVKMTFSDGSSDPELLIKLKADKPRLHPKHALEAFLQDTIENANCEIEQRLRAADILAKLYT